MGDAEVKDQAPAPGLIPQVVPNLYIAQPLASLAVTPCCVFYLGGEKARLFVMQNTPRAPNNPKLSEAG
jgi:hypothetical protein